MNNECNQLIRVTAGKSLSYPTLIYILLGEFTYICLILKSQIHGTICDKSDETYIYSQFHSYCKLTVSKNDNTHLKSLTHVFPSNGYITQNFSMHERSRIQKPIDKQIRAEWWNTCTKRRKSFYNIYILSIRHKGHVYTHVTNLNWEKSHGKTHIWNSFPYRPMNSLLKF